MKLLNVKALGFTNLLFGLLCVSIVLFIGCKKEDAPIPVTPTPITYPAENNIIGRAFPAANFNTSVVAGASYYYEMGFRFSVTKKGKLTKMGVKTPESGTYRVVLWDAATKTVLGQVNCSHQNALEYTIVSMGVVSLAVGQEYYITFQTLGQQRYGITPKVAGDIPYPRAVGFVSIKEYGYYSALLTSDNGSIPKFPIYFDKTFARGFPEFEFQPDPE